MLSVYSINKEFISNNILSKKYILTYRFSQSHIELLFSRITNRYDLNNNPNVIQGNIFEIKWAKKKKQYDLND